MYLVFKRRNQKKISKLNSRVIFSILICDGSLMAVLFVNR